MLDPFTHHIGIEITYRIFNWIGVRRLLSEGWSCKYLPWELSLRASMIQRAIDTLAKSPRSYRCSPLELLVFQPPRLEFWERLDLYQLVAKTLECIFGSCLYSHSSARYSRRSTWDNQNIEYFESIECPRHTIKTLIGSSMGKMPPKSQRSPDCDLKALNIAHFGLASTHTLRWKSLHNLFLVYVVRI